MKYRGSESTVVIDRNPAVDADVTDKIIEWLTEHECYDGESIMQSDAPQLTAAELLSDIVDEILQPDVEWD